MNNMLHARLFMVSEKTHFSFLIIFIFNLIIKKNLSSVIITDFFRCLRFVNTNDLVMEKEKYVTAEQLTMSMADVIDGAGWAESKFTPST